MQDNSFALVIFVGVIAVVAIAAIALRTPLQGTTTRPALENWELSYDSSGNVRGLAVHPFSKR